MGAATKSGRNDSGDSSLPTFIRLEALQRLFALGRQEKPLWWYPSWSLVAGLLLGLGMTRIDPGGDGPLAFLVYEGDPESARSFVSLAASSVATITSLTLTITVVTLQLASSQYSPRLIEHYLNDRGIRAVISLFMLTFAFSVSTLLNVRFAGDGENAVGQVPGAAISLLVLLIIGCLGALVFFVFRVTESVRVETILTTVRDRTVQAIEARNQHDPDGEEMTDIPEPDVDGLLITARRTGFFVDLDREVVGECDAEGDIQIWLLVSTGDFVTRDSPVAVVSGWDDDPDEIRDTVTSWLRFDTERWIEADYSYGVRSLVDVAIKALSPGINDPTTAVMAVNRIAEVMALAGESHPDRVMDVGEHGRLYVAITTWESTLHEILGQLALYGRDDVQVVTAVSRMLWSLQWIDSEMDRMQQIRDATEVFAELIDVERPGPDQRDVDEQLALLRESLHHRPVRRFRRDARSFRIDRNG